MSASILRRCKNDIFDPKVEEHVKTFQHNKFQFQCNTKVKSIGNMLVYTANAVKRFINQKYINVFLILETKMKSKVSYALDS